MNGHKCWLGDYWPRKAHHMIIIMDGGRCTTILIPDTDTEQGAIQNIPSIRLVIRIAIANKFITCTVAPMDGEEI